MADYSVVFARSASKELRSLDSTVALRIVKRIETLSQNPRPAGVVMLEGAADLWRGVWGIGVSCTESRMGGASGPIRNGPRRKSTWATFPIQ